MATQDAPPDLDAVASRFAQWTIEGGSCRFLPHATVPDDANAAAVRQVDPEVRGPVQAAFVPE
jgi:hypothetical protein